MNAATGWSRSPVSTPWRISQCSERFGTQGCRGLGLHMGLDAGLRPDLALRSPPRLAQAPPTPPGGKDRRRWVRVHRGAVDAGLRAWLLGSALPFFAFGRRSRSHGQPLCRRARVDP